MSHATTFREPGSRTRMPMAIALLLVVVLAQTWSVVHAEEHLFHESEEHCVNFHQVEKQPGLAGPVWVNPARITYAPIAGVECTQRRATKPTAFQARAPPLFRR